MSTIASLGISSASQLRRSLDRVGKNAMAEAAAESTNPRGADALSPEPAIGSLGIEFSAQSSFVNLTIDATTADGFQNLVPAGRARTPVPGNASVGNSGKLASRLTSVSPKLAQGIEALLDFIRRQNPDAAKALEETLEKVLESSSTGTIPPATIEWGSAPAPSAAREVTLQQENIQFALEATFAQLQQEVEGGVSITVEQVQLTFQANLTQITGIQRSDPLVLDLDGNGLFDTTTVWDGHDFDLLGKGYRVRAATVAGGDAYLAYDRNGNGIIDDGTELFGDQNGAIDGFAELAKYDDDGNGQIDANDGIFSKLMLFRDSNRDGRTDLGELVPISDARIASIQLRSEATEETSNGNLVVRTGFFVYEDGSTGRVGELLMNYLA